MRRQRRLKLAAVLMAMAMTAGCAATLLMGVGGLAALGTYKWVEGTMEKDYPRPMRETFAATMEAARRLNLRITSEQYTPAESKILASTQDGTDVKVELISRPNEITTVKIRFGMMGNKDWSGYYHRQIMKILQIPDQP
jgi:ABC-type glycerol-3-phosphate transport system substrate-binding protein